MNAIQQQEHAGRTLFVPSLSTRWHRPAWAFAKKGRAKEAAHMLGLPHHFCHVSYERMVGLLWQMNATNEQAARILKRANVGKSRTCYVRLDLDHRSAGGSVRGAAYETILSLKGMPYVFCTSNKLVYDLAKEAGVMMRFVSSKSLPEEGFTVLFITKAHKRGQVREMTRAVFMGRRIATLFY